MRLKETATVAVAVRRLLGLKNILLPSRGRRRRPGCHGTHSRFPIWRARTGFVTLIAAKDRIEGLEEDLENAGLALFQQERLGKSDGERLSAEDFLQGIGMGEFVEQLPGG